MRRVIESKKGFRLLNVSDFHLGSSATSLIPHKTLDFPRTTTIAPPPTARLKQPPPPPPPPIGSNRIPQVISPPPIPPPPPPPPTTRRSIPSVLSLGARFDKKCSTKSSLVVGTADGGLGILIPIDEGVHRRLALLQQIMSTTVPTTCALNPRQFRLIKCARQRLEKKRGILDGNLLWQFANLEGSLQDELAFAMGTTSDIILDNLQDIDISNLFF